MEVLAFVILQCPVAVVASVLGARLLGVRRSWVAVVLSGSGSTREHVQRLGRILRKRPDKEAVLYEVVAVDTTEENISRRRGVDGAAC